jgi:hypothetical protein
MKIFDPLLSIIRSLADRAFTGLGLIPLLVKKPAVLSLWLLTAYAGQIVLLLLLLTLPTVVMPAIDDRLEVMYPATIKEKFFGLRAEIHEDPRLNSRKQLARTVLWTSAGGIVLFLFLIHIPTAIQRAEARANKQEQEADAVLASQPSQSVLLYRSAIRLATDAGHIASLEEKISALDQKLSSTVLASPPSGNQVSASSSQDDTVLLPSTGKVQGTVSGKSQDMPFVGTQGRYRIKSTLGSGATGVAYRAYDTVLERDVALKELLPEIAHDQELVSRFRHEAKVLAQLAHPGIVHVYDFLEEKGRFWIVIELVRGGELSDLLTERGIIPVAETAQLGRQMAEAMAYAHARGVVHRDFKPSNVMLTAGGSPKITDFGLAKLAESRQRTQAGTVLGSPLYMSPEQAEGRESDSRSDIYSFGVVLYQMLTGKVPFQGEHFTSVLSQHISSDPLPPRRIVADLPEELETLVLSLLDKKPDKRIQEMSSVAKVLQNHIDR